MKKGTVVLVLAKGQNDAHGLSNGHFVGTRTTNVLQPTKRDTLTPSPCPLWLQIGT